MAVYKSVTELVGNTPMLEALNFAKRKALNVKLLLKLEYFNPAGSVKDRVAKSMIEDAEKKGKLKKGGVIVEPTSGNTGIGLASIAAAKGYKLIVTMPETMSEERRKLIKAYGARIVLTDGKKGMQGAIDKAREIVDDTPGAIMAGQFVNPANPDAHRKSTGLEIWNDTNGEIDILICGVGTGGTLTGVGSFLKKKNPEIKVIAVEPSDSPVLGGGSPGPHGIQGIGAGFVPDVLDTQVYDEVIPISTESAYAAVRELAATEGILVGISSGAALAAAIAVALREENNGKTLVVVLPDTGERYLSTPLFE